MNPLLRMNDLTGTVLILLFCSETTSFIQKGDHNSYYSCSRNDNQLFLNSTSTNFDKACPLKDDLTSSTSVALGVDRQFGTMEGKSGILLSKSSNDGRIMTRSSNRGRERLRTEYRDYDTTSRNINRGVMESHNRQQQRSRYFINNRSFGRVSTTRSYETLHRKKIEGPEEYKTSSMEKRQADGLERDGHEENVNSRNMAYGVEYFRSLSSRNIRFGNERSSGRTTTHLENRIGESRIQSRRLMNSRGQYYSPEGKMTGEGERRIQRFGNDRRQRQNNRIMNGKIVNKNNELLNVGESAAKSTRAVSEQQEYEKNNFDAYRQQWTHSRTRSLDTIYSKGKNSQISDEQRRVKPVSSRRISDDLQDNSIVDNFRRSRSQGNVRSRDTFRDRNMRTREFTAPNSFRQATGRSDHREPRDVLRDSNRLSSYQRNQLKVQNDNNQLNREMNYSQEKSQHAVKKTINSSNSREARLLQSTRRSLSNKPSHHERLATEDNRRTTRDNYRSSRNSNEVNSSSQRYATNRRSVESSRMKSGYDTDSARGTSPMKIKENIDKRNHPFSRDFSEDSNKERTSRFEERNTRTRASRNTRGSFPGERDNVNSGFLESDRRQPSQALRREALVTSAESRYRNRRLSWRDSEISGNNGHHLLRSRSKRIPEENQYSIGCWFGVIQISLATVALGYLFFSEEKNNNRAFSMGFLKKLKSS